MEKFIIGLVLFIGSIAATVQLAPVIAGHYAAKDRAIAAAEYDAKLHADRIARCASGKTNYIMYNGVHCKGNN